MELQPIPDPIDVSDCDSAQSAAETVADQLCTHAELINQKPDIEISCQERGGVWIVFWEAGPSYWAVKLTGGEPMLWSEPEITGLLDGDEFSVECEYSFALGFYG